jgi:hypothetical protein
VKILLLAAARAHIRVVKPTQMRKQFRQRANQPLNRLSLGRTSDTMDISQSLTDATSTGLDGQTTLRGSGHRSRARRSQRIDDPGCANPSGHREHRAAASSARRIPRQLGTERQLTNEKCHTGQSAHVTSASRDLTIPEGGPPADTRTGCHTKPTTTQQTATDFRNSRKSSLLGQSGPVVVAAEPSWERVSAEVDDPGDSVESR